METARPAARSYPGQEVKVQSAYLDSAPEGLRGGLSWKVMSGPQHFRGALCPVVLPTRDEEQIGDSQPSSCLLRALN